MLEILLIATIAQAKLNSKDSAWLQKNRDANGCIALASFATEASPQTTCPKTVVLDVRPSPGGTLKSETDSATGSRLCCYDWKPGGKR